MELQSYCTKVKTNNAFKCKENNTLVAKLKAYKFAKLNTSNNFYFNSPYIFTTNCYRP